MSITRPRRVLFLDNDDRYFWSHRRPLADALLNAGIEVGVATTLGIAKPKIEAAGFTLFPVRFKRGNFINPALEIPALLDVLRAYCAFRPDLVHQFTFKPILYGSWAARRIGVRAVINAITGLGVRFALQALAILKERFPFASADRRW